MSLSNYVGFQILLRFHFNTIDGGANNYEGWYVDDIVIAGSTSHIVDRLVHSLSVTFPIKDLGWLDYFLGLEASYNSGACH